MYLLGWQSWLDSLLFQGLDAGLRVASEAGAQGVGLPSLLRKRCPEPTPCTAAS